MLDPDSRIDDNEEDLDMGHLLSKMTAPNTSIGFSDVIDHIISIFNGGNQQTSYSDVSERIKCWAHFFFFLPIHVVKLFCDCSYQSFFTKLISYT